MQGATNPQRLSEVFCAGIIFRHSADSDGRRCRCRPTDIPGEVVYVPFPVVVESDGMPDWAAIPSYTVTGGPDPAENGSFGFSLASDGDYLYLRFIMKDANIIAGEHGDEYWNEDSLEFYINDSGDLNF